MQSNPDPNAGIPIADAVKFIVDVADLPVVGNMSGRQFLDAAKLSTKDWESVWSSYWTSYPVSRYIDVAALLFLAACIFHSPWWSIPAVLLAYKSGSEHGQSEGYGMGFGAGHENGFCRAHGVTTEKLIKIVENESEIAAYRVANEALQAKAKAKEDPK